MRQVPYDGRAADIWSLGVVLYTLTVGRLPWKTDNIKKFMTEIEETTVEVPDYLEVALREMIDQMLKKDPAERPTAEQLLKMRWLDYTAVVQQKPRLPVLMRAATDLCRRPPAATKWKKVIDAREREAGGERAGMVKLSYLVRRVPPAGQVRGPSAHGHPPRLP
jgi:serine/threonine protein kinase